MRLVLTLGLVFVLCSIAFLRDRNMPRRPSGQPAAWKLWLWCTIFVGLFGLVVAVSPHWAVYRPPGMPRSPRP